MSRTCCVCCKQLSNNDHKDIFDEKLLINLQEKDIKKKSKSIILRDAIELIIGTAISEIDIKDSAVMCETCFQKVESYVKFRSQLVALFGKLNNTQVPYTRLPSLGNMEIAKASQIFKAFNTESEISKEIVNIDTNNIPTNLHDLPSSEPEINNDSLYCCNMLPNFQNFVNNNSDSSSDCWMSTDNFNVDVSLSKKKSDIESDVNVYSGEDSNEILELSVQYRHNETVNISSTESEEDNDYGPAIKKIKPSNIKSNSVSIFFE